MGILDMLKGMMGGGGANVPQVVPEEIAGLVAGGAVLVDVREPMELQGELGVIKGARNIPLSALATRLGELDKSGSYVVICRSGHRSASACGTMTKAGFEKVYNVTGGMMGYRKAVG